MPYSTHIFMWQCRNGLVARHRKRHRIVLPNIYVVPPAHLYSQAPADSPRIILSATRPDAPAKSAAEYHAA